MVNYRQISKLATTD